MSFKTAKVTLAAAVATNGTFTLPYPAGLNSGSFRGAQQHTMYAEGLQALFSAPKDFTLAFGASLITVTYKGATTIPANTTVQLQLSMVGSSISPYARSVSRGFDTAVSVVTLGVVATSSATAVVNAVAVANATAVVLGTAVALDVPRSLIYKSSDAGDTTQTLTASGTDEFGVAMTETFTLNGTTSVVGSKAFAIVTGYKASAALTGNLSIGTGTKLGLPFVLASAGYVLREVVDGAAAGTAGTFAAADASAATALTGDVRGTWIPNTAPNGTHDYELIAVVPDASYLGAAQA
jgi:hypothetical protein